MHIKIGSKPYYHQGQQNTDEDIEILIVDKVAYQLLYRYKRTLGTYEITKIKRIEYCKLVWLLLLTLALIFPILIYNPKNLNYFTISQPLGTNEIMNKKGLKIVRLFVLLLFINFKITKSNLQSQNIILLNNLIGIQIPLVPLCRLFNNQIRYVFLMSYLVPLMLIQLETTFQDHRFFLR